MATTKKITKTNATKKTNDSKATKTNNTKAKKTNNTKKTEEPSVVDEFLDTVVGETMTQEDADNNENRKKELKERWEKLGMDEGMQEVVKESVADMYAKQAAELIKEAETGVIGEEGEDGTPYIKDFAKTIVFPEIEGLNIEEGLMEQIKDETLKCLDETDTNENENDTNDDTNDETNGELNEAEKQFNELFEEKKEPEQPVNTNPQIVYVNSAMGASWD